MTITTKAPVSRRRALLTAAAAFAGSAIAAPAVAAVKAPAVTDPVIPMIAEMDRLYDEAGRLEDHAIGLLRNLPEGIQYGPSVMLAEIPDGYDDLTYSERNQILELKRSHPDQVPMIELVAKPRHFYSEEHLCDEIDRRDIKEEDAKRMIAEWRPKRERVARVRDEIGHTALLDQVSAIRARASELNERIEKMPPPRTLAGVIALIEMTDYEMDPALVSAVAGLRALAAGGAA